jgi:hypothetical protein
MMAPIPTCSMSDAQLGRSTKNKETDETQHSAWKLAFAKA